jgi:hypothetical protein
MSWDMSVHPYDRHCVCDYCGAAGYAWTAQVIDAKFEEWEFLPRVNDEGWEKRRRHVCGACQEALPKAFADLVEWSEAVAESYGG